MSVDFSLRDPGTGGLCRLKTPMMNEGGTHIYGETYAAELNVTYNYGKPISRALSKVGVAYDGLANMLNGLSAGVSLPLLTALCELLPDEPNKEDYWEASEGNAGHALHLLKRMAQEVPDNAIWTAV